MRKIEAYECEFCKKIYKTPHGTRKHENCCNKNPKNERDCFGCDFLSKKEVKIEEDGFAKVIVLSYNAFHCDLQKFFVYPPRVERNGTFFDDGETENVKMPNKGECKHRVSYEIC